MKSIASIAAAILIAAAPASAQSVKSAVTASNGAEVTVYSDDFANRYEYTSPTIKTSDGFAFIGVVKKAGVAPEPELIGSFVYSGEWRRYSSALFKGGDPATFIEAGRDVGRCSSSRYSRPSCTLTESFHIKLTLDEIKKHAEAGVVAVQVRAQDTTTALIEIPVAYIDAVREVSKR